MIKLIKSFKYDNSYDYIKMFSNEQEQEQFFNNCDGEIIEENNYIKIDNSFNVNYNFDYLENEGINYLFFNNGYKDIYAFIIKKEYVRKNVTRLIYDVDVIQTYMFNFSLDNSFVERKVCSINEISEYDEGLNIGEHIIESEQIVFNKDSVYFAMFNGIKEQQIIFGDNGKISNVINLPFPTQKPLTLIDGIQYPLYFMPLKETYSAPVYEGIDEPEVKSVVNSARKLLGKPYVWGGNYPPLGTDEGTDCSGLCQWAFNDCGLLANIGLGGRWTTYTMIEHATYIKDLSVSKPSDVIFSAFNSSGYPEHVALISKIEGNNISIIEAQQEGVPILERIIGWDSTKYEIRRMI